MYFFIYYASIYSFWQVLYTRFLLCSLAVRWLFGGGGGVVALGTPRWVGGDVYLMCVWFGVVSVSCWIGR
ncbi:hypothetical protein GIB67_002662 [Kingdonia uniflora]|uniref:Uncharacterized protein n=1 Tax=Kingdonia uniflora TaxID=39325 RepID=A0A7J7LJT9_9MAGN|nr:hypothetical protein GIB67_002662 [Kingdonia uniflora]